MHFVELTRDEYLESVRQIEDYDTLKFSKQALDWWDDYYSWIKNPPLILQDDNEDKCYLFYHISKDNQYLTIHNIFTPKNFRFKGFAYKLLRYLFLFLSKKNIKRIKMYCVSSSLNFYMSLGFKFWGVNNLGQYYCDFKMPKKIGDIKDIVNHEIIGNISQKNFDEIYEKLKSNGDGFDEKQLEIHNQAIRLMGDRYLFKDTYQRHIKDILL
eukprot:Anaeramoba_flamelloidesa818378_102.p1 GENE.a818378_102~~a818378_102.p1  ORF type:complete len:212 (-),score=10.70 a818378_102:129-764(-)